jgi:hypothetical protein
MAKRDSMSKARQSRNRKQEPAAGMETAAATRPSNQPAEPIPESNLIVPGEIIDDERMRLMKAEAVLGCVAFALLYEDWLGGAERPPFALAVAVVQDLIDETVERLGSSGTK